MKYKEEKKKAEKAEMNWWLFDMPNANDEINEKEELWVEDSEE
jgi:hypothetical protein